MCVNRKDEWFKIIQPYVLSTKKLLHVGGRESGLDFIRPFLSIPKNAPGLVLRRILCLKVCMIRHVMQSKTTNCFHLIVRMHLLLEDTILEKSKQSRRVSLLTLTLTLTLVFLLGKRFIKSGNTYHHQKLLDKPWENSSHPKTCLTNKK